MQWKINQSDDAKVLPANHKREQLDSILINKDNLREDSVARFFSPGNELVSVKIPSRNLFAFLIET